MGLRARCTAALKIRWGAVDVFLRKLRAEPERVRSLAHWAWIENAVQDTPAHFMPQ